MRQHHYKTEDNKYETATDIAYKKTLHLFSTFASRGSWSSECFPFMSIHPNSSVSRSQNSTLVSSRLFISVYMRTAMKKTLSYVQCFQYDQTNPELQKEMLLKHMTIT
eukprot:6488227-Amphidinium_carterae.2